MIEQKAEPASLPECDVIMKKIFNNVGVATKVSMVFNPYTINAHKSSRTILWKSFGQKNFSKKKFEG